MSQRRSRRRFLKEASALAISAYVADSAAAAQPRRSERIRIGVIGTAARGNDNLNGVQNEEIVALCDVDESKAVAARKRFPKAQFYTDYRVLLEKQKDIEAVVISTPDHHHAFAALPAMRLGKHVYCEKPLAHSVHETRLMMETAAKHKAVTQMGTQIHAGRNYRRVVEIVQAGILGPIRRVHVWCERQPDGGARVKEQPVPAGFHYDLWLGPAPFRPFPPFDRPGHKEHVHFHWRWWWDYAGGVLADMACHFIDLPHWALGLRTPTSISSVGHITPRSEVPIMQQVDYEYPARGNQPAVHLTWYHGVQGPSLDGKVIHKDFPNGVLFEGEKGRLIADYGKHRLLPEEQFRDVRPPQQTIPPSPGHHREWLDAIRNGGSCTCNFDYGGALTEAVLLGNVGYRLGARIQYEAKTGRVTNNDKAEQYLRREYRKGWTL